MVLLPAYLVNQLRMRKRLFQYEILKYSKSGVANLSRLENIHQNPTDETFHHLMNKLQMPLETYFSPHLESQPMEVYVLRDQIIDLLDSDESLHWQQAEELIQKLAIQKGFETGINRQFILSCKARLNELMKLEPLDSITIIKEAMTLTYGMFDENTFMGEMLLFEESNLLHTLARAYQRMGKSNESIAMLRRVVKGISLLPAEDREKEKKLAPVLLTLSDMLIQEKKYDEAMEICLRGDTASIDHSKGKYSPDFAFNKGMCSHFLGKTGDNIKFIRQSYFSFALLRKMRQAQQVLESAKEHLGVTINTYGVENMIYEKFDTTIKHGDSVECNSIGSLIQAFRWKAYANSKEIYEGICSQGTYNKIENGQLKPNIFFLEPIVQRLGRDINKYFCLFANVEDFQNLLIRDEINSHLANGQFEFANELLGVLKAKEGFSNGKARNKKNYCIQFVKNAEATIFGSRKGYGNTEYLAMLKEAMEITRPKFNEKEVSFYRLSYYEVMIVNQMAIHYCESGELSRGLKLFEGLRESINSFCVDEKEKVRMYINALYNYSKFLGRANRCKEALDIIKEGEEMALRHKRLTNLTYFAVNHAFNLWKLKKIEESVPVWAMAYYGLDLLGDTKTMTAVSNHVQKYLNINFD